MTNIAREILFETSPQLLDAAAFLSSADQEVINLFSKYERAQSMVEKQKLVEKICKALTINMQIEEEILYPAIQVALKEKGMVSAAKMNRAILKYLISEIKSIDANSDTYDIKIKVLSEQAKHTVKERQGKLFPKVKATGKIDLWKLGTQLALRKEELFGTK